MKTKYLFSKSSGPIDESTLFVGVWIGAGVQDQRDKVFFESLAAGSSDYLFKKYDAEQADFLQTLDRALVMENSDPRSRHLHADMSAKKLRTLLKSGLYDEWARTFFAACRGLRRMNLSANSLYHCAAHRADANLCNPHT